ncbi:glucuronate isomerase [Okibacterium sp. HSC-33S16]|uniref:glucuronate isomerase n=1 Tax=Okibacterium sp. HSC-33S16 TaxID=2910965 RepID=UPI0020A1C1C1|nr:glucuronate isomerase [Okibacterium sp. HSC-33S16]MCP2030266.1 glucuronate isomerase [Okibacterium sp. HSC-33S16]
MKLQLDPDRLFPVDPSTRSIARALYEQVESLPIISPHGHVDPAILVEDQQFPDPAELFIRYDHYVTRLMHAAGIDLDRLGIPNRTTGKPAASPREVWRTFSENWHLYAGTASGYWLQSTFAQIFGIDVQPSADNADAVYDTIQSALDTDAFRPRALFERFNIEVLATTDDPMDSLAPHQALAADPTFSGRVLPTFRPDAYLNPATPGWVDKVAALADWNGSAVGSYAGYVEALTGRRRYFVENGAVSADHGVLQPLAVDLDPAEAAALFAKGLAGNLSDAESRAFAGHMLLESARMSTEDGLVMTVHPGVYRNHSSETFATFGPDTGHDIPVTTTYVENLRPLLEKYGNNADFHLVLFSVDETVYSREVAPLAGFYPSVYIGAPWWFLDAPDSVLRFRSAVTETAGFYRSSGFIDDTRAFLSIPARHDMARRLDSAFLARLVREGRIDEQAAGRINVDLVDSMPRKVFKL